MTDADVAVIAVAMVLGLVVGLFLGHYWGQP